MNLVQGSVQYTGGLMFPISLQTNRLVKHERYHLIDSCQANHQFPQPYHIPRECQGNLALTNPVTRYKLS